DRSGTGDGRRNVDARLAAFAAFAVGALVASPFAAAQHQTAYDVEDGARAYQAVCANCHGPDGDLIAGIHFGRGIFRRPLTDDEIVDRKSTRLNSSHVKISYAVFCLKKKKKPKKI